MFKIIGGIIVITACGLLGIAASNRYTLRPRDLRRYRSAMQMLETEIIYGCTPLPQAFSNIAGKVDGPLKGFFSMISEDLLTGFSYSLSNAWVKALEVLIAESCLNNADKELIVDFGKVLGSSDREDQKKHFELLYIQLKQHEEMAEEARRKNGKMYKSLGFLSGIVIFILLV